MGAIIPLSEKWHEEYLLITLLQKEDLDRKEVRERIKDIQKKKMAPFEPHSNSAYNYWIRSLKKRFIIDEQRQILSLTGLGKWIASSKLGDIFNRNAFVYLMCDKCTNRLYKALRTPLPDTIELNAKGDFFMDIKCPNCGSIEHRWGLSSIVGKEHITDFYNQAIEELEQYFDEHDKLIAQKM